MFGNYRRNRLRNRVIWVAIGVCVMTFGIWLNYSSNDGPPVQETTKKVEAETPPDNKKKSETGTEGTYETYLIKEINGVVKVFTLNGSGEKELYLITTIPFELLSESDQNLLKEGVELDTEDELGKFLENFDS